MKKFVCSVCGYVYEGDKAPDVCPQCNAPASKFTESASEGLAWADQHVVGVAKDTDPEILEGLRQNFTGIYKIQPIAILVSRNSVVV